MLVFCVAFLGATAAPVGAGHIPYRFPGSARYSVPKAKLDEALSCRRGSRVSFGSARALNGRRHHHPVLLVHGTGATRRQNWGWNYWPELRERRFEVCWVALPGESLVDIQISSEYVARAIQRMHRATGEDVDVLGHSQGGLSPRWAIKWFPSGRFVADYIALASPNHGTSVANAATAPGFSSPAVWQMRRDSNFITALNRDNEGPGDINYTSIYTENDELVQPVGTQDINADRTTNFLIQDLCPGRPVDHLSIAGDAVAFAVVLDALTHAGPGNVARAAPDCNSAAFREDAPEDFSNDWTGGQPVNSEPRLRPYAR